MILIHHPRRSRAVEVQNLKQQLQKVRQVGDGVPGHGYPEMDDDFFSGKPYVFKWMIWKKTYYFWKHPYKSCIS